VAIFVSVLIISVMMLFCFAACAWNRRQSKRRGNKRSVSKYETNSNVVLKPSMPLYIPPPLSHTSSHQSLLSSSRSIVPPNGRPVSGQFSDFEPSLPRRVGYPLSTRPILDHSSSAEFCMKYNQGGLLYENDHQAFSPHEVITHQTYGVSYQQTRDGYDAFYDENESQEPGSDGANDPISKS